LKSLGKHLLLAQNYWKVILKQGDNVVDMTCGNGYDALFLAKLALTADCGSLLCFDMQKKAIEGTKKLLLDNLEEKVLSRVNLRCESHVNVLKYLVRPVKLIVYNLGYLPGGDKSITTMADSTLNSVNMILPVIEEDKGFISVVVYPGHKEGQKEEQVLLKFLASLDKKKWNICYHCWINHLNAPSLFWIGTLG